MTPIIHCRGHEVQSAVAVFSPDGRRVLSGGRDTLARVWDITGMAPKGELAKIEPGEADLKRLWQQLGKVHAAEAHPALWQLVAAGEPSVAFLSARLQPTPHAEPKRVKRWIAELDAADFAVRDAAMKALERQGGGVEEELRACLKAPMPLEVRRRVEQLLALLGPTPELLRGQRALCVLEQIGTIAAQDLLERLARGAPRDAFTEAARDSLARLRDAKR
jgi:hypothetical protein